MQVTGLGVHQEGGESVGVAQEQDVRQGHIAPVEAGQVQAHQQHDEGVNQSFGGVRAQVAGEQRTVRQRELQVPGDQNRLQRLPFTGVTADDHGDRGHSWQFELLQSTQDLVLSLGHLARDLLHGVHLVAHVHESHDVAGDASRQVGQQVLLRPGGQGLVPGQREHLWVRAGGGDFQCLRFR